MECTIYTSYVYVRILRSVRIFDSKMNKNIQFRDDKQVAMSMMSFKIEYTPPEITLELIGHFSIDGNSKYHDDLSQLKYFIQPTDLNNVHYDLNVNIEFAHCRSTSNIKLDDILQWIAKNFNLLEKPLSVCQEPWLNIDFICHRATLISILCSPYPMDDWTDDGWIICACKYLGTIYLCEFYTDNREYQHVNRTKKDIQNTIQGHKFEKYMLADEPQGIPNPLEPVNECEEFRCVFKAEFGGHSLLYGAQIDGICSEELIKDTLVKKNFKMIELKTLPIYIDKTYKQRKKYDQILSKRILRCWAQNYLVGIKKLVCGWKDENGIVNTIKKYKGTAELLRVTNTNVYSRGSLDRCKLFCIKFLDDVKRIVTKDYNECIYKFRWKPSTSMEKIYYTEESPAHKKYFFLQSWFITEAEKYRRMFPDNVKM